MSSGCPVFDGSLMKETVKWPDWIPCPGGYYTMQR